MKELSKSIARRIREPNFMRRYFIGDGVDIGGQPDPLSLYAEFFPLMNNVRIWDLDDGDAQFMEGVPDASFDFVHSSHCLEHMNDPQKALQNWMRILKPGGFMIVLVPDEDLYEQGLFPSTFNRDHKRTFTIWKDHSWNKKSLNLIDLFRNLGPECCLEKVELLSASYRFRLPRYDQTVTPVGECAIEFVLRKRLPLELEAGGLQKSIIQPASELRVHYNQYRDDYANMKQANNSSAPFGNTNHL